MKTFKTFLTEGDAHGPGVKAICKLLGLPAPGPITDLKHSKEPKYWGVSHAKSELVDAKGREVWLTFDNSTDSGEFELNSLAPLAIERGGDAEAKIKQLYVDHQLDSAKKINYILKNGSPVIREIHLGKTLGEPAVAFVKDLLKVIK